LDSGRQERKKKPMKNKQTSHGGERNRLKILRPMEVDLKRMKAIHKHAEWLRGRDSNSGNAASLTDAIEVLAAEAIRLHEAECDMWRKKKGRK